MTPADVRVLAPDDLPRARLMEEFARDETSCLVGSLGLWQGIDVAGPSVSLVDYPLLNDRLSPVLLNRLRNAFGHNAAALDHDAQVVRYRDGSADGVW